MRYEVPYTSRWLEGNRNDAYVPRVRKSISCKFAEREGGLTMREIIFRARRIDNDGWVEGDLIQLHDGRKYIVNNKHGACIDDKGNFINTEEPFVCAVDPSTVGQYTCLKDRNGVRIFDGDVVQEHHETIWVDSWGKKHTVYMDEERRGWYPFACGDGCGCCEEDTISPCYCEVVGNIYDNPELLEVPS